MRNSVLAAAYSSASQTRQWDVVRQNQPESVVYHSMPNIHRNLQTSDVEFSMCVRCHDPKRWWIKMRWPYIIIYSGRSPNPGLRPHPGRRTRIERWKESCCFRMRVGSCLHFFGRRPRITIERSSKLAFFWLHTYLVINV